MARRHLQALAGLLAGLLLATPAMAKHDGPHWSIVASESRLTFRGEAIVGDVEGGFSEFGGDIRFDPKNPENARIVVLIDTTSLYADPEMASENLKGKAFFHTAKYPRASVDATGLKRAKDQPDGPGTRYRLRAQVTIRDTTRSVSLPVTVRIDGKTAHATGKTQIDRLAFGLGTGAWSPAWLVDHQVTVTVAVKARRVKS